MNLLALFFVIDHSHPTKRIQAFQNYTKNLSIVSYYRKESIAYKNHYNLGHIPQNRYFRRFIKIILDVPKLKKILRNIPDIDVVYAWNFDIALLFVLANLFSRRKYIFIYEVADIKPILLSTSIEGKILRALEQFVLNQTAYLCVTSSAFLNHYFDKFYSYRSKTHILENKVYPGLDSIAINKVSGRHPNNNIWRIGLVGIFRCNKSLQLLSDLAKRFPEKIKIILAGSPEEQVKDTFDKLVNLEQTEYTGTYNYPDDLIDIYDKIDIIWSADLSDLSTNSKWLLPNRIYEAGLFAVPQLCFSDNVAICKYINLYKIGWEIKTANIEALEGFVSSLTDLEYRKIQNNYTILPPDQFVGDEQIRSLLLKIRSEF